MPTQPRPVRPFLKWAGNKFRIVERVRARLPEGRRLVEPFVGSGAVFLNTDYPHYLLSDSNADLITLYTTLQEEGPAFIEFCRELFTAENNRETAYYALREAFNTSDDPRLRAALFVYLNRHGYNGLCRYNKKGRFNVPFGRYKRPYFPADEMHAFHHSARKARFLHETFVTAMERTQHGDVVYCDPPYVPLSHSANFTAYSAGGFDLEEQTTLAHLAGRLAARGVPVLISNHQTEFTERVYAGAAISSFQVQRLISCNGEKRSMAGELLALFT